MTKGKNKRTDSLQRNLKKEMAVKNNRFARYMLLRYSLALFFFSNIYWLMILAYRPNVYRILPVAALFLMLLATAEQFRLYGKAVSELIWTKRAFTLQSFLNVFALVLVFVHSQFSLTFPVFNENLLGKFFVIILQILGLLLAGINLHRINQIQQNQDKFYQRFQYFLRNQLNH